MNNLAIKLRNGIQQAHGDAEHSGFMKRFLAGQIERDLFAKLLNNFYWIYCQIETELEFHKDNILVSGVYFPQLNRKANLEKDLAFYYGNNWREKITPGPAVQAFVARLREVSASEPALLIAHAYTRYMGDLSGGQGLKKIVRSVFNLSGEEGSCFYEFEQISDVNAFKGIYRQALNELPVSEEMEDKIVAEAIISFKLNIQMMRELEESFGSRTVMPV
ncbi:MAG TPA: biliverdin-producing heme oxygenase [Halomicronema sp.]